MSVIKEQIDVIRDRKKEYLQLKSDIETLKDIYSRMTYEVRSYEGPCGFLEGKAEQVLSDLTDEVCCLVFHSNDVNFQKYLLIKNDVDTSEVRHLQTDVERYKYEYEQADASISAVHGLATKYKSDIEDSVSYRLYVKYPQDEDVINLLRKELRSVIYTNQNRIERKIENFFRQHINSEKYKDVDLLLKEADYIIAYQEEEDEGNSLTIPML